MDVLPSWMQSRSLVTHEDASNQGFNNFLFRQGEVKRVIYPEDAASLSKRLIEYDVLVQHRENNTAVSKMYHHCKLANDLAGLADKSFRTLRVDPQKGASMSSKNEFNDGVGSKVTLLCLNGSDANALIIGGVRDTQDTDVGAKALGHHLHDVFNGASLDIRDDGSILITMGGKTQANGQAHANRDTDGAGSQIELKANGNIEARTPNAKQSVVIDHKAGTIKVTADKELTLISDKIMLGDQAGEHAVLGDTLLSLKKELVDLILQHTHTSAAGESLPPTNAPRFSQLKAKLKTFLSSFIFVKAKK